MAPCGQAVSLLASQVVATEPNLESAPQRLSVVTEQLAELSSFLDPAALADQVSELEAQMGAEGFWDNQEQAARVSAEHARVSRRLERWQELSGDGDDLATMLELVDEDASLAGEFEGQLADVERRLVVRPRDGHCCSRAPSR